MRSMSQRERIRRKHRNRIIKLVLLGTGVIVIVIQILFLTGVIPMPQLLLQRKTESVDAVFRLKEDMAATFELVGNDVEDDVEEQKTYLNYVFVGDSRYVGMSAMKKDEDIFLAKNNMGYDYLIEQLPNICSISNSDVALIVGLGVNDINYSSDKYIAKLNELADELDCQIYYMSVNPVDEQKEALNGYSMTNARIDEFNTKLKTKLSSKIKYIDTNTFLKQNTFTTVDGLHYDTKTYEMIYDYIKTNL